MKEYFIVFLISMLPIIELRGAIPYSQAVGLPMLTSYFIAIIGNLLPVPFVFLLAKKLLHIGTKVKFLDKLCKYILKKGHKAGEKIIAKAGTKGIIFAIALFIGIPLPGTGAYTGTLAASILDVDFKSTFISAVLGLILSGIIMSVVSFGAFNLF